LKTIPRGRRHFNQKPEKRPIADRLPTPDPKGRPLESPGAPKLKPVPFAKTRLVVGVVVISGLIYNMVLSTS
jgi:hypothetical protein